MLQRPVHLVSPHPHQQGYTACGRLLRRVDTTPHHHHSNCERCRYVASPVS